MIKLRERTTVGEERRREKAQKNDHDHHVHVLFLSGKEHMRKI